GGLDRRVDEFGREAFELQTEGAKIGAQLPYIVDQVITMSDFDCDATTGVWTHNLGNGGAAGVDGQTIEQFEADLKNNLYKIWNRMSWGTYFPPPVRAVSIPKKSGGQRILGVPTVADRVAQIVVKDVIEPDLDPVFLPDSYGYRPRKAALDAVGVTRER